MHLRGALTVPRASAAAAKDLQDEIDPAAHGTTRSGRCAPRAVTVDRGKQGMAFRTRTERKRGARAKRQHSLKNPEGSSSWDDGVPFV